MRTSRRQYTVYRLLYLMIAIVVCLFAFAGTIYSAMTQEVRGDTIPPLVAEATATATLTPTATLLPTATIHPTLAPLNSTGKTATPTAVRFGIATATPQAGSGAPAQIPDLTPIPFPTAQPQPTQVAIGTPAENATPTASPTMDWNATITAVPFPTPEIMPGMTITPYEWLTPTPDITASLAFSATPSGPIHRRNFGIALATPIAPTPAATVVPSSNDPHITSSTTTSTCAACHRIHTASSDMLRTEIAEENACYACHSTTAVQYPGKAVQPAFTGNPNTATGIYKHDVAATTSVHRYNESTLDKFADANRHVECEDCHSPHAATRGAAVAPFLQRVMSGTAGVDVTWVNSTTISGYTFMAQAEREYQVCFKCHSNFITLPTYLPDGWNGGIVANGLHKLTSTDGNQVLDSRNMASEFNPYGGSYHPVTAQGINTKIPPGSWVTGSGITSTSMIYCSSCHNNPLSTTQGAGPHGSSNLHILAGNANYSTEDGTSVISTQEVCFQCHKSTVYGPGATDTDTNFRSSGGDNLHASHSAKKEACYACHDSHGSEQLYLINFDVSAATPVSGLNSLTAFTAIGNGGTCALSCHGGKASGTWSYGYP